ncbi:MAG: hypothetical protein PUI85_02645 [Eubacteriales bacterium]|nr:hypothetical protein [Eubacteriales bacterium]MDY3332589.1 hypothetical protein [Gallibacter sp.]
MKISLIKDIKDERGSTFVEAAVVLPITLIVVVNLILFIVFMSEITFDQVNDHKALRKQEGIISETRLVKKSYKKTEFAKENTISGSKLTTINGIKKLKGLLIDGQLENREDNNIYMINEREIIVFKKTAENVFKK